MDIADQSDDLDKEAKQEEEVELDQGHVDLELGVNCETAGEGRAQHWAAHLEHEKTLLHRQVGVDDLVHDPGKLKVQLVGKETDNGGGDDLQQNEAQQSRGDAVPGVQFGRQKGLEAVRAGRPGGSEAVEGLFDVGGLVGGVGQQEHVEDADADDLDHAVQAQGVVHDDDLVHKGKNEERQVHGHRVAVGDADGERVNVVLDRDEDIAAPWRQWLATPPRRGQGREADGQEDGTGRARAGLTPRASRPARPVRRPWPGTGASRACWGRTWPTAGLYRRRRWGSTGKQQVSQTDGWVGAAGRRGFG